MHNGNCSTVRVSVLKNSRDGWGLRQTRKATTHHQHIVPTLEQSQCCQSYQFLQKQLEI